jgi:hypothetical protein
MMPKPMPELLVENAEALQKESEKQKDSGARPTDQGAAHKDGIIETAVPVEHNTSISEMLGRIHSKIGEFTEEINEEFEDELENQLKAKRNGFFIVPNKYWDQWFQKLFAQIISVKLWIIALITVLLYKGLVTDIQFASILGVIMALKGGFQVAGVFRKNGHNGEITEMDKT